MFNLDLNVYANDRKAGQVIGRIKIFDVDYQDKDDPVFQEEYVECGEAYECPHEKMKIDEVALLFSKQFNLVPIGKYKTESWSYEKETRILVRMTLAYKIL